MSPSNRPIPQADEASREFFEGAQRHELMLMRCQACGTWRLPSHPRCFSCWSTETEWAKASGRGTLYTFTVARIPTLPEFAGPDAQILAVVELEQGVRINTTLVGLAPEAIEIGMPVKPVRARVREDGTVLLRYTGVNVDLVERDEVPKAPPAPAADSEEHAQVRSELEQRNAQQAESRQKNCDGARAEIQKLANIPARRVMRPNEDGTLGRMSEEEYEARLKRLREVEAENCQ